MKKKGVSDTRISEITGIPYITIMQWKKGKGYRPSLYKLLKQMDESALIKAFPEKEEKEKEEK